MTKLYQVLDNLPSLPDVFVQEAITVWKDPNKKRVQRGKVADYSPHDSVGNQRWPTENTVLKNGVAVEHRTNYRYELSDELHTWVHNNIASTFMDIGLSINDGSGVVSNLTMPHTDFSRDYTLMYVLDTGGPDVRTTFWKEHNQNLRRENWHYPSNYDDLEYIDHLVIQTRKWTLLNARVLHSIENLESTRLSLQVAFHKDHPWSVNNEWTIPNREHK